MKKFIIGVFLLFGMFFITSNTSLNAYGFGFRRNDLHMPPDIGKYESILNKYNASYVGDTNKFDLYLTMDAGYDNGELPKILDILNKYQIKVSFFITGDFIKRFPDLVIRLTNEGHAICNHTYSHQNLTKLDDLMIEKEIKDNETAYFNLTNKHMLKIVRPPAGEFDEHSLNVINRLGYKTIFWSIAYKDWLVKGQKGVDYTYKMVINNLHKGAIILMHSVSSSNREALPSIIEESIRIGYTFKTLDSM